MTTNTFDAALFLKTPAERAAYLTELIEDGPLFASALRDVVRSMPELTNNEVYLSDDFPASEEDLAIPRISEKLRQLGLHLQVVPVENTSDRLTLPSLSKILLDAVQKETTFEFSHEGFDRLKQGSPVAVVIDHLALLTLMHDSALLSALDPIKTYADWDEGIVGHLMGIPVLSCAVVPTDKDVVRAEPRTITIVTREGTELKATTHRWYTP
jgi:hypothetical protein